MQIIKDISECSNCGECCSNILLISDAAYIDLCFDENNKPISVLELEGAKEVLKKFDADVVDIINYTLPLEEVYERNLIIIRYL